MKPKLIKKELLKLEHKKKSIEEERKELINKTVESCSHPQESVMLFPIEESYFGYNPPWLICFDCGLTQEGWGCGFTQFKHIKVKDCPVIKRNAWLETRTKAIFQDGDIIICNN